MPSIAIVADTSADLLPDQAAAAGIRLVPLTVSFGDESFEAVTELPNEDFYRRLTAPGAPLPRTAAPNPQRFEAAFQAAFDAGAEGVVCVTISQGLSATWSSAVQAAKSFPAGRVEVVDSRTTTHGEGLIALGAAQAAASGASLADVKAHAEDLRDRSHIYFVLETLEYLQKGGRIGRASALLGTMLSIKPILTTTDGVVTTADKRRTAARARVRFMELVTERPVEQATVVHTGAADIEGIRDEFVSLAGLSADAVDIGLVGPIGGTHVGPGMYGVALILTA